MKNKIAIAIDGPAAAGKSTVAKLVAEQMGYIYVDTGAMYRAITYVTIKNNISPDNSSAILNELKKSDITLTKEFDVFINGENVTDEIRSNEVTQLVSKIASIPEVRKEMVQRQQQLVRNRGIVMDGRDIGTHVIPDAEVKIFLIASVDERAIRRHSENKNKGIPSDVEKLKIEIAQRDKQDMERVTSPLKKAEDAIEIDTTQLSIKDVVNQIIKIVEQEV
ncbi:(d)CMP kinase [Gracilibacillus marinus]|jgi:CMP/dCMP kinase|uniref:Cytidylate kinase n=1 Tax=Gracilibacillus marinus TaxID=630535 RepID=A0ABV8VVK3_9BACI